MYTVNIQLSTIDE